MPMPRKSISAHRLCGTTPEYVVEEAVVESGRPRYPKGISPAARLVFKRLCALLEKRRSLTSGDGELLRLYCVLFDRHARALAAIEKEGEIRTYTRLDNRGEAVQCEKPNLWLKVAENSEAKMISVLDRLGLTPINRSKVKPAEPPKEVKPVDPGDELLDRGRHNSTPDVTADELADIDVEGLPQ